MSQGTQTPWKADSLGRVVLVENDDYIRDIIGIALGSGDSENPFQDIGLGEEIIFSVNDFVTEATVRRRVEDIFRDLETNGLARLVKPNGVTFPGTDVEGEMFVVIKFINLETDRVDEVAFRLQLRTTG